MLKLFTKLSKEKKDCSLYLLPFTLLPFLSLSRADRENSFGEWYGGPWGPGSAMAFIDCHGDLR
jgi:hypothetical protein